MTKKRDWMYEISLQSLVLFLIELDVIERNIPFAVIEQIAYKFESEAINS